ncbi:flagellar motor switch protein FliG [Leptospira inadai serovar Lyme str. 10]|uniref:Flagellar motor switch protein FliG n=2 Tax=Leptospira inadai serovar Lyme TaxID=293084 RepID=V6HD20_9LEPT|nr:flagellar motor switch protein FliG [Leptospira inadai]EQA37921.1 flagellar motor switch protein FliG [Leptospira inadai serovar Lyme str. 10]PNV72079.1 flagellar motor switch protein FliG [Leptospira inadai serovar Lyme]
MTEKESISRSQKVRKAALLLLSLDKEAAAKALSQLEENLIEEIVQEMAKIRTVSKTEKEEALLDFQDSIKELSGESRGGIDTARELLYKSIGKEKSESILGKLDRKDTEEDFSFLNDAEPQTLAQLLLPENPQTIAVTLAFLNPKKAAETLKFLPKELQSKVAFKLANTTKTHPDAIRQIARILKKKYEHRDKSEFSEAGGTEALASILNHMDKSLEETILKDLEEHSPELASQVREKLYTFEDVLLLNSKEMRLVINRLGDDEVIATALRGSGDEIRSHFFEAMSKNRANDILENMELRGKVTLKEITDARNRILTLLRDLEEVGEIVLKKDTEDLI